MEKFIEKIMFASRWILAPIYVGLTIAIGLIFVKFFQEVFHAIPHILEMTETDLILVILSMLDMALVAGLIFIVVISSYEALVHKIDLKNPEKKLPWMGTMDVTALKNKLGITIVSISSIQLLKAYMNVENISNDKLLIATGIHITFVISAFIMGYLDKIKKGIR